MLVDQLFEPKSIVVVGASNELSKPGGRVLKHLIEGDFKGELYVSNPKEKSIQGIKCYNDISTLPETDLAIIAIASKYVPDTIEFLVKEKNTKAFIILSAGFSEIGEQGKIIEDKVVEICNQYNASLIGPNCVGVLTPHYKGAFTGPIPKLDPKGVDFVTGSGATAVFILEQAVPLGVTFASLFSVGNSAQIGVEDIIKYWDETFDPETSSKVKMIYIEQINKPDLLLKHSASLIEKGCKITAIKSGTSDAGSRAVSSHTGALAGSDTAVEALFRKAGIVRCDSKQELVYTAAVFMQKELKGENLAVITHAGGPGVMLTDALSHGGLKVPHIKGEHADELLSKLFHGSSVANPIDFLATGTAQQLKEILDFVDNKFENIDGSVVIFGTPGLFDVTHVYDVLHEVMKTSKKPIFPVLPSLVQAKDAIEHFVSLGRQYFPDEVILGKVLSKVFATPPPTFLESTFSVCDREEVRNIIENAENGYLKSEQVTALLDAAKINRVPEYNIKSLDEAKDIVSNTGFPIVMKVVGPLHKSDIGGVELNIQNIEKVESVFNKLMSIEDAESVLIQPMISGTELFLGAKKEDKFGHIVLCGIGGIFVEVLKDIVPGLTPINKEEALTMIDNIKAKKILEGVRGKAGINIDEFAETIVRLSDLLENAPEIVEMDLNPLLAGKNYISAVDARIKIEK